MTSDSNCYCLVARSAARHLTRLYERHLAPAGLTSSQFSILGMLDGASGMTVAGLAGAMEMERTTLVRVLRPLRERGWVVESGRERRAPLLRISPVGVERLGLARPLWGAAQREFESMVGPDAASTFRESASSVLAGLGGR